MNESSVAACDVVHLGDVETLDSVTSGRLVTLSRAGVTGELFCSCTDRSAHVYLQRGRVAWASDCKHRRAFTAHLKQHAGLPTDTIEAVVGDCRATKRPIGETLIERKLATEEQVRAALRHQIGLALHIGECRGEGTGVFLPRNYQDYDVRFTFDASEIVSEEGLAANQPARCSQR
ncbi:MAG TPA: DUF4388 domain-containing protein [Anaeromyxobacteraceae bacterium]